MSTTARDLSIFKTDDQKNIDICANEQTNIIEACDALKRLVTALLYYHKFDLIKNENDQNIFSDFIMNIYPNLINDYIHLIDHHSNQMQQITESLKKKERNVFECDIKTCKYTTRHRKTQYLHQNKHDGDSKSNENDKLLNFFIC